MSDDNQGVVSDTLFVNKPRQDTAGGEEVEEQCWLRVEEPDHLVNVHAQLGVITGMMRTALQQLHTISTRIVEVETRQAALHAKVDAMHNKVDAQHEYLMARQQKKASRVKYVL